MSKLLDMVDDGEPHEGDAASDAHGACRGPSDVALGSALGVRTASGARRLAPGQARHQQGDLG
jgi:hypothetical protein